MFWRKHRRREKLRKQPFPPPWHEMLTQRLRYYAAVPASDQREWQEHINVLLAEKHFEGCGGLEINEEIRLLVAAQAAMLLLHRDTDYYPKLVTILVYPSSFFVETRVHDAGPLELHGEELRSGEAWQRGVVILAWDSVLRNLRHPEEGANVVIHEFAHQLDLENGLPDGYPNLDDQQLRERWPGVFQKEYDQLVDDLNHDRRTLIDPYAEEDPAEFFAVVTELFFARPQALRRRHPDLYDVLKGYFHQDPATVLGPPRTTNHYTPEGTSE